jgi:hypothetical protein
VIVARRLDRTIRSRPEDADLSRPLYSLFIPARDDSAVKRVLVGGLTGVILLVAGAGCGGHSNRKTELKLVATSGFEQNKTVAVFHLRCDPPGGDIAHPARACTALEKHPDVLLHPAPVVNYGGNSWDIAISGRFEGRPVSVKTTTAWTKDMPLIRQLGIARQLQAHIVAH